MGVTMNMRLIALSLCFASLPAGATPPSAGGKASHSVKFEHPADAALMEESPGHLAYRSFPASMRLYTYDKDLPGKSTCAEVCASAWRPLAVSSEETGPVGDWTVVLRADGQHQWAYKKKPVYTRYHDMAPDADSEKEGFHLLRP